MCIRDRVKGSGSKVKGVYHAGWIVHIESKLKLGRLVDNAEAGGFKLVVHTDNCTKMEIDADKWRSEFTTQTSGNSMEGFS